MVAKLMHHTSVLSLCVPITICMHSYGLDLLLDGSLLLDTGVVLQMKWPADRHCHSDCYMPELLAAWMCLAVAGFVVQGHLSGNFSLIDLCRSFAGGRSYTAAVPVRKAESISKVACQRTFTYPDNQAYNYFHPDRLPPALQAHTEVIYYTADQLANFFGFQVRLCISNLRAHVK
jgi:hypothetical protein